MYLFAGSARSCNISFEVCELEKKRRRQKENAMKPHSPLTSHKLEPPGNTTSSWQLQISSRNKEKTLFRLPWKILVSSIFVNLLQNVWGFCLNIFNGPYWEILDWINMTVMLRSAILTNIFQTLGWNFYSGFYIIYVLMSIRMDL